MKKIFRSLLLVILGMWGWNSVQATEWVIPAPKYADFVPSDTFYMYNVGQNAFLYKGEAWGTQACVSSSAGFKFVWISQADGSYKAWDNSKSGGAYLFRTNSDSKAGTGNKATFADGGDAKNTWNIVSVGTNIYTIQMVSTDADADDYDTEQFLGIQLDHASTFASDEANGLNGVTHAAWYDVVYSGNETNCQWAFVKSEDYEAFVAKNALKSALEAAESRGVNTDAAAAVFNNPNATVQEVNEATKALNQAVADEVDPSNPLDQTSLITNPTFDSNMNGWSYTTGAKNHGTASNQTGAFTGNFFENWSSSAFKGKMYQTIKDVPNGVYKVSLAAFVNVFDPNNAENKTQYVFFNDTQIPLTTSSPTLYSSMIMVDADTLSLGLAQDSVIANWMGIDNASLVYYGHGLASYQYLSTSIGDSLTSEFGEGVIYTPSYYTAVTDAVAAAQAATTVEAAKEAYLTTKSALEALRANVSAYKKLSNQIETLNTLVWDKGLNLENELDEATEMLSNASSTTEEILAFVSSTAEKITKALQSDYNVGDDVTDAFVTNPTFTNASLEGWTHTGGSVGGGTSGVVEVWNNDFNIYQDLSNLKNGAYRVETQAFYRTTNGNSGDAWTYWTEANGENTGNNTVHAYLYASDQLASINNIFSWNQAAAGTSSDWTVNGNGTYEPNGVSSANECFTANESNYLNQVSGVAVNGKLRIGIKCQDPTAKAGRWTVWNDFKLIYLGSDASVISPILSELIAKADTTVTKSMYSKIKSILTTSIDEANTAVAGTDGAEMLKAYASLSSALDSAQVSIAVYDSLATAYANLKTALTTYASTAMNEALSNGEDLANEVEQALTDGSYSDDSARAKIVEINTAIKALKQPKGVASDDNPLDYTYMIENPGFTDNSSEGWTVTNVKQVNNQGSSSVSSNILEGWSCDFDVYQDITGLPEGTYRVVCKGYYRDGTSAGASKGYSKDSVTYRGYFFANSDSAALMNIIVLDEGTQVAEGDAGNWSTYVDSVSVAGSQTTYYYPNQRVAARSRFDAGYYDNELYTYVDESGTLRIGFFNHTAVINDWTVTSDWKLYYLGTNSSHASTTGIQSVSGKTDIVSQKIYTVDGREINRLAKGLNIVRQKTSDGKIFVKKVMVK